MRKPLVPLLITLLLFSIIAIPATALTDTDITTTQTTTITTATNGLHVEETITLTNHATTNATLLRFWIQTDVTTTVTITATQTGTNLNPTINGNYRDCNLTAAHLTLAPQASLNVTVTYTLPTSTTQYITKLPYNTTQITVTYNTQTLFSGRNLITSTPGSDLSIQLYNTTEAPLGISTLVLIFLIVVLILTLLLLVLRRQRRRKRVGTTDNQETLATKKDLLLELLKDLEKRYRAKDISDETYTKLKEEYKAQAVDAMRRLEDIKKPSP